MNAPPPPVRSPLTAGRVLILASLIVLIVVALATLVFTTTWTLATLLGLIAVGLALYVAASLVP